MKAYLTFFILLLTFSGVHAQNNIDSVFVYNYFPERGFTTAGLSGELSGLTEKKVDHFLLTNADVDSIKIIMRNAKVKKLRQTKTGGGAVFAEFKAKSEISYVVILGNLIIDFSHKKDYWVRDQKDLEFLSVFLSRIKKEHSINQLPAR